MLCHVTLVLEQKTTEDNKDLSQNVPFPKLQCSALRLVIVFHCSLILVGWLYK